MKLLSSTLRENNVKNCDSFFMVASKHVKICTTILFDFKSCTKTILITKILLLNHCIECKILKSSLFNSFHLCFYMLVRVGCLLCSIPTLPTMSTA